MLCFMLYVFCYNKKSLDHQSKDLFIVSPSASLIYTPISAPVPHCLDYCGFRISLGKGTLRLSTLFFFLKIFSLFKAVTSPPLF